MTLELTAAFEKTYPGGASVRAELLSSGELFDHGFVRPIGLRQDDCAPLSGGARAA